MRSRYQVILLAVCLGVGLTALIALSAASASPVHAMGAADGVGGAHGGDAAAGGAAARPWDGLSPAATAGERGVGLRQVENGRTCYVKLNDDPTDYLTVQAAVDASTQPSDVVKVAGTCSGVTVRAGMSQTVFVSKSLTIRGGYTWTNWLEEDPAGHPTTLDALKLGRVVVISGAVPAAITVTIEGLRVTGGDATLQGGFGGGIAAAAAAVTISDCQVSGNTASGAGMGIGGGVMLILSKLALTGSQLEHNVASASGSGVGGGLAAFGLVSSTLRGNSFVENAAGLTGGGIGGGLFGLALYSTDMHDNVVISNTGGMTGGLGGGIATALTLGGTLDGNRIANNTAGVTGFGLGGGLFEFLALGGRLSQNVIAENTAAAGEYGMGGGLFALLTISNTVSGNRIVSNTASAGLLGLGGGLAGIGMISDTLTGNWVAGNVASAEGVGVGGGVCGIGLIPITLDGNVIISNTATLSHTAVGGGGGLYAGAGIVIMVNNVVADNHANTVGSGMAWGVPGSPLDDLLPAVGESLQLLAGLSGSDGGGFRAPAGGTGLSLAPLGLDGVDLGLDGEFPGFDLGDLGLGDLPGFDFGELDLTDFPYGLTDTLPTLGVLLHNTIADNHSSGQGVFVGPTTVLTLTNNIIAGHGQVGITATADSAVWLVDTLWHENRLNWGGDGVFSATINLPGDPAFVDPSAWNYHIKPWSAAINLGLPVGVLTDMDGEARPLLGGYDLGADESPLFVAAADLAITKTAVPASAGPGDSVTYTLVYQNRGPRIAAAVTISDLVSTDLRGVSYSSAGALIVPMQPGVLTYSWGIVGPGFPVPVIPGPLLPGQGGVITVTGALRACLTGGTTVTNAATISATTFDQVPGNNRSAATPLVVLDRPPVAAGDRYATEMDVALAVSALGVLANDSDANCDPLESTLLSGPAHGATRLRLDGSFVYTPTTGFEGRDQFRYQVCAGADPVACASATVDLAVGHPAAVGGLSILAADRSGGGPGWLALMAAGLLLVLLRRRRR